jgi:hypothetical protein
MKNNPLRQAYRNHKIRARRYGIPFLLTFDEWLRIWSESGHLHERGPRRGQYCMGRRGDTGPYAIGNVDIIPTSKNCTDANMGNTRCVGRVISEETRRKIGDANRGKRRSDEARQKMSEARRHYFERRAATA